LVAFTIAFTSLKKYIKLDLTFKKFVVKPVLATAMMGICSYFTYKVFLGIINSKLATIISILVAVIIYLLGILVLKVFSKEEIEQLPQGKKLSKILEKIKIY
jgi:stage V sporulation protein B